MTVMIGIITAGNLDIRCTRSLIETTKLADGTEIMIHQNGPYLDMGRNTVVDAFRSEQYAHCDHLLFVDSDIGFDPAHIQTLVDDDLPIVAGVYHSLFATGIHPVVYEWIVNDDGYRVMSPIQHWNRPKGEILVPVEAVGTGFLMIQRNVFEMFLQHYSPPTAWFVNEIIDGVELGEDLGFCYRAAELGIPIVVDRRVQVSHIKNIVLQGPYASTE